jgi:hypothetical protein
MPHPKHGGWLGHMLPGWFFLAWSSWWLFSIFRLYLRETSKHPYAGRSWYDFPLLSSVPLEPLCKVFFTFIGINGELWAGHESYRCACDLPLARVQAPTSSSNVSPFIRA